MQENIIYIDDDDYPEKLRTLGKYAPEKLYYIGNKGLLKKKCYAVVGSRKASGYGKWAAYNAGKKIAENDFVTVSGMAYGCDAKAHEGALDANGYTIAVLGCGVDICYPMKNKKLRERIIHSGLIISEYPKGTNPMSFNFPRRNRIISGLSEAVIVAEAGIKSGSLITAEIAMEHGVDVKVFPGNITNVGCLGGNKLIQDGAEIITNLNEIINGGLLGVKNKSSLEKLSLEEKHILTILEKEGNLNLDELANITNYDISKLAGLVTMMEIKGILSSFMGKVFIAK